MFTPFRSAKHPVRNPIRRLWPGALAPALAPALAAPMLVLLLLAILTTSTHASSSAEHISMCNADSDNIGCASWADTTTRYCPETFGSSIREPCYEKTVANRGACLDEPANETIMSWAAKPVLSNAYTLRSGNGPDASQDVLEYEPDKWMTITLKTLEADKKYRGLLLHADNANNAKVGEWGLSEAQMFWHPPVCGPRAVLHSGAAVKSFTNHFRFKGPATGTGAITFKALVKVGTCK